MEAPAGLWFVVGVLSGAVLVLGVLLAAGMAMAAESQDAGESRDAEDALLNALCRQAMQRELDARRLAPGRSRGAAEVWDEVDRLIDGVEGRP